MLRSHPASRKPGAAARAIALALALAATLFAPACKKPSRCLVEGRDAGGALTCPPPIVATAPAATPAPAPTFEQAARTPGAYWTQTDRTAAIADGTAVIHEHQCTRCHTIDQQPGIGRPFDCVACHVFIKELTPDDRRYKSIAKKHGKDTIDRYIRNIQHELRIPDLSGIARRIRPEWTARFLPAPYDLRPVFDESMIRNQLTPGDVTKLIRYFAAVGDVPDPTAPGYTPTPPPPRPTAERIAQGKQAFIDRACTTCHEFGGVPLGDQSRAALLAAVKDAAFAPNLMYVRDRVRPEIVVDWIVDPKSVEAAATMPNFAVPRAEAEAIRDFLFYGDPGPAEPARDARALLALPPAADHEVGWSEVKEKVLGHVCVHCHMNDHELDQGPGNRGGLGYPGIGLSFRTYERTVWGAFDVGRNAYRPGGRRSSGHNGRRYSVMETRPGDPMPRLLLVLVARRLENQRDDQPPLEHRALPGFGPDVLGMPLGLPALTDEQIGIVRAWIEQGCPGPTEVTGKPGFTDGFLVPDGPIAKNQGCELRAPADPPPAWNTAPRPHD